jgi:hypothetical protein
MPLGLDYQPGRGRAHLAGIEGHGTCGRGNDALAVSVGERDQRRLATELERHRHQTIGRERRELPPRGDRAGERDPLDAPICGQRPAGIGARSGDHVEKTVGNTRFGCESSELQGCGRSELGRLGDDCIADSECRSDGAACLVEREVPRSDRDDDSVGLELRVSVSAGTEVDRPAPDAWQDPGVIAEVSSRHFDFEAQLGWELARRCLLELHQLVGVALDRFGDPIQDRRPVGRRAVGPVGLRCRGRVYGARGIRRGTGSDRVARFSCGGIRRREVLAAHGRNCRASDPMVVAGAHFRRCSGGGPRPSPAPRVPPRPARDPPCASS